MSQFPFPFTSFFMNLKWKIRYFINFITVKTYQLQQAQQLSRAAIFLSPWYMLIPYLAFHYDQVGAVGAYSAESLCTSVYKDYSCD